MRYLPTLSLEAAGLQSSHTPRNVRFLETAQMPGRVFVNITTHGCGSGCSYCYIDGPTQSQNQLSHAEIVSSLDWLRRHPRFQQGPSGTVISLCPDTEPFKTTTSAQRIGWILQRVLPWGNRIQIATKEQVPAEILMAIERHRAALRQVVLFTTITTISRAKSIEPHAAAPDARAKNFESCRLASVVSCLYIKPFLPATAHDYTAFAELAGKARPDAICVGVLYKSTDVGQPLTHPVHGRMQSPGLEPSCLAFAERLKRDTQVPVFHTAVCVSAWASASLAAPRIWLDYPELCVGCRDCAGEFKSENRKEQYR